MRTPARWASGQKGGLVIHNGAKVQRATLSEQIAGFIRDHIVSGELKPGEALPSSVQLAADYGVSRTIVREAMKSLEARGLITIANGKRASVSPITNQVLADYFDRVAIEREETLIELLELRRGIEAQGAYMAASRRTPDEMATIWSLVHQMRLHMGETDAFLDSDVQLHLAIVAASHNRMLYHVVDSIREPLRATMREGRVLHSSPEEREAIQVSHEVLVQFIEDQRAEEAAACMARHFDETITGIKLAMERSGN
jgi:DNA-binding FadR family transcriptional regulator